MPYIRDSFGARDELIEGHTIPGCAGDLNFLFTHHMNEFLKLRGLSYENINAAVGALECAKLELYRRVAAPYEDTKIAANGDVYYPELLTE
jgi:hypothetical protein